MTEYEESGGPAQLPNPATKPNGNREHNNNDRTQTGYASPPRTAAETDKTAGRTCRDPSFRPSPCHLSFSPSPFLYGLIRSYAAPRFNNVDSRVLLPTKLRPRGMFCMSRPMGTVSSGRCAALAR